MPKPKPLSDDVCLRLRKHLEISTNPRSFTIGLTDAEIHVYLHKRLYKKIVPDDWEGFPVRTIYVGQVRPASASPKTAKGNDD